MQGGQRTFSDKSHLHVGVICVLNINLSLQKVSKYYSACKLYMIILLLLLLLYGWKLKKCLNFTSGSMLCEMESASLYRTLELYMYEHMMPLEFAGIWGRASDTQGFRHSQGLELRTPDNPFQVSSGTESQVNI